jgi:hypothetical protein
VGPQTECVSAEKYFFLAKAPTPNMNGVQFLTNMGGSTLAYNIPAGGWVVGMRAYFYNTVSGTWQIQVKANASTVVLGTGMTAGGTVDVNRNVLSAPFPTDAYFSAYMTTNGSYGAGAATARRGPRLSAPCGLTSSPRRTRRP